jgi:hypothetical protein
MIAHSDSSSEGESCSQQGSKPPEPSPSASLHNSKYRLVPLVWQLGGTLFAIAGFLAGTNTLSDVSLYLALLGFATAVFLSWYIRDRRRPQDLVAVIGYLLYSAGFGLLSVPDRFALGEWTPAAYALGSLFLALLLPLTWLLFVEYLVE